MTDLDRTEGAEVLFRLLANLFVEMDVFASPSECHGLLCGLLVQGKVLSEAAWLRSVASYLEQVKIDNNNAKELLGELYKNTASQLQTPGFELALVLPDEEVELSRRVESLGLWCQGFLAGFGNRQLASLSEEARESLEDFAEIAQIARDDLDETEEDEQDLMQISEYVRMAAILIYSELMTDKDKPLKTTTNQPPPYLH